jgi:hypothetical protein
VSVWTSLDIEEWSRLLHERRIREAPRSRMCRGWKGTYTRSGYVWKNGRWRKDRRWRTYGSKRYRRMHTLSMRRLRAGGPEYALAVIRGSNAERDWGSEMQLLYGPVNVDPLRILGMDRETRTVTVG